MKGGVVLEKECRVERHIIKRSHPMFDVCNVLTKKSKNVYNYVNYYLRKQFFETGTVMNHREVCKEFKHHDPFLDLGSQSAQQTLKVLAQNWKSYFVAIKDWSKKPEKYLGKPEIPKYLDKNGRFVVFMHNIQSRIENGYVYFGNKILRPFNNMIKTNVTGKLMHTKIVPKIGHYVFEVVYEMEIPEVNNLGNRVIGIDLGLNNFCSIQNNFYDKPFIINGRPLKSKNKYYNNKISNYKSKAMKINRKYTTEKIEYLQMKRSNYIEHYFHRVSRYIINYCIASNVDTIVIGKNDGWKQKNKIFRTFTQIPFEKLIWQIQYKARDCGIKVISTEESYTSKASFLDSDMMNKGTIFSGKRIKRGLYKSIDGTLLNADINGAGNIIRKVFPNAFNDGIKGVRLHPTIINL